MGNKKEEEGGGGAFLSPWLLIEGEIGKATESSEGIPQFLSPQNLVNCEFIS